MTAVTRAYLDAAMTYGQYRSLIDRLLADGKTTGTDHSEKMIDYTSLNAHRMDRIRKTVSLEPETRSVLSRLDRDLIWLAFTEAWCGDAAQNLPIIAMMVEATDRIQLKLLLRDEHPDLMDNYLTNGGRAIPKLVCLDGENLAELGTWGPRPEPAQEMVRQHKTDPQEPYVEFVKKVQLWYAKDKGSSIQSEFQRLLRKWGERD